MFAFFIEQSTYWRHVYSMWTLDLLEHSRNLIWGERTFACDSASISSVTLHIFSPWVTKQMPSRLLKPLFYTVSRIGECSLTKPSSCIYLPKSTWIVWKRTLAGSKSCLVWLSTVDACMGKSWSQDIADMSSKKDVDEGWYNIFAKYMIMSYITHAQLNKKLMDILGGI